MQEKEEEMENTRKNYQRQIEALQSTIENEVKSKGKIRVLYILDF